MHSIQLVIERIGAAGLSLSSRERELLLQQFKRDRRELGRATALTFLDSYLEERKAFHNTFINTMNRTGARA